MRTDFLSTLVGLFAKPASENPTVAIMEASFKARGLNWRYITTEVEPENLDVAVAGSRAMGWRGFNCSIPHKVSVMDHLDDIGRSAEVIGAVNTVINQDGHLTGENTDGSGFVELLSGQTTLAGKRLVVFGAGGAARAVSVEMALAGVGDILIVNRDPKRGGDLTALLNERTPAGAEYYQWGSTFQIPRDTDLLFNATPVGMFPDIDGRLDFDPGTLTPDMFVAEGVNNPPKTNLLRLADNVGCRSVDGSDMLVNVCSRCIEMWTGRPADKQAMRTTLDVVLGRSPEKG